ncbi:glycine--tRNA ligase [Candidatus Wolfebacteria bacterium]|nr:glycine--tRNA ligase [Candidatus Wolfebacteria bacterium]
MAQNDHMEKIVSLAKRRGFVYQGSEIYGGLAGTWDYGPMGIALKQNIKNLWWKTFVESRADIYGIDAAILMHRDVWVASGHVDGFNDPMVECTKCKKRFRSDFVADNVCPECGGELGPERFFNMMFRTNVGTVSDSSSVAYLRPETAGGIFTNFKNILDTFHPSLPFGIAQVGKAFRNEIAPRDFLFRAREFEQMEIEWFIKPPENDAEWQKHFEMWQKELRDWVSLIGLDTKKISKYETPHRDLAHYSKRTVDLKYEYPFGVHELYGLAYRIDHDLSSQQSHSGVDLSYFDQETKERFIPHVVEPSLGLDRTVLALLDSAYMEEEAPTADGKTEERVVLTFKPELAPVKVAVLPLMRKDGLAEKAREVFDGLKTHWQCQYDETGSIGKRYRRQDEIGTPYCVTIDYNTLEGGTITARNRDSMKQERVAVSELTNYFKEKLF